MTWIIGIIGLGIMVFIHELGHFVAAKLNGVGVETFSLGWGPKLVGFTRGGTSYRISWFPIGGYCKMKGELVPGLAGGGADAVKEAEAEPRPEKGTYLAAAPWRRIMIAAFGPLFNLVFAALIFMMIWWVGFTTYSADNRVILATDYSQDSFSQTPPATLAGLKTGDRITAINGTAVESFQDILENVSGSPGRQLAFTVQRNTDSGAQTLQLTMTPRLDKDSGSGQIGVYAWIDPVVDTVARGSASAIAGLRAGDRILSIDGRTILNTIELSQALKDRPSKASVAFARAREQQNATLVFVYDDKGNANLGLGFASQAYRSPRMGPIGAAIKSGEETWNTITLTLKGFGLLFQGINLRNAVAGPVRIVYYIGETAKNGFEIGIGAGLVYTFRLIALLCVVLFLMNLLPIPATDGGQIIIFIVEAIRQKPLRPRLIWQLQLIGFTLLIGLLVFALFNDTLFFTGR
jgi:regulator of sigma E protease